MENRAEMPLPFGLRPILASHSPRRRELMGMLVPSFGMVTPPEIDEIYPATLSQKDVPEYLSRLKAQAIDHDALKSNEVVVTADTVVLIDDKILGKPHSREEAIEMIATLSGKKHHVVTGVTLTDSLGHILSFSDTTEVFFAKLHPEDIELYVDIFKPYDKAGAYGIQEWIGAVGIEKVNGCFYNVMGLPLSALYKNLEIFSKKFSKV